MIYVGIDPGQKGGITCIDHFGLIVDMFVMPEDITILSGFLRLHKQHISIVGLEKSQSYPKQGIASTFNYGVSYGIIQGILIAHEVDFTLIPPRTWQKHMIIPSRLKDPKAKALKSANKIFKKQKSFWLPSKRHKKPHDGLIDSALIAEYCRRSIVNK